MSPDILKDIPDSKPVRVFLPLKNVQERYRLQGVYGQSSPPHFSLLFKPGELPSDDIDTNGTCLINVDMGGPNLSLEARIVEIANRQQLLMVVEKSISHEQMRDFFRVDAVTSVISTAFSPEVSDAGSPDWSLKGKTIDISGSGILAVFPEKPPADSQIQLEITLPSSERQTVYALANQVRATLQDDGNYCVAYSFTDIDMEDRDKIIGCCLEIQRKMLRLKVQVKDI